MAVSRTSWKPGETGNPNGRLPGARSKLTGMFVRALAEDFEEHGVLAIERARTTDPVQYLKVVASLVPKEVTGEDGQPVAIQVIYSWAKKKPESDDEAVDPQ